MNTVPHDKELEKTLLGEIIYDPTIFDEVNNIVSSDSFYDLENAKIYDIIQMLAAEGTNIDIVTITTKAKREEIKINLAYLSNLTVGIYTSVNAVTHARMVEEKWMLRKILQTKNIFDCIDGYSDPFQVLSKFSEEIWKIENKLGSYQKDLLLSEHLDKLVEKIEAKYKGEEEPGLMSFTFPSLNKATGGIMSTDYVIVYGLDKSGKSTFAERLLLDFAYQKKNIGLFSLEMDFEQVAYKNISMVTGIEYLKMRNPRGNNLLPHELEDLKKKISKLRDTKIYVDDKTFDFHRVMSKCRLWKRKYNINIFAFDYMGLFNSSDQAESVKYMLKDFSRKLKQLAKELNTPIILISQANKEDKTADSIDLLRDCDFAMRICKPVEIGIKSIKRKDGTNFEFNDSHFLVTVERSRHGKNKQNFVCGYMNENFVEIDIEEKHETINEDF